MRQQILVVPVPTNRGFFLGEQVGKTNLDLNYQEKPPFGRISFTLSKHQTSKSKAIKYQLLLKESKPTLTQIISKHNV